MRYSYQLIYEFLLPVVIKGKVICILEVRLFTREHSNQNPSKSSFTNVHSEARGSSSNVHSFTH